MLFPQSLNNIVYTSVTVSYGHLTRGLKIVSVAIPMASSCSMHLPILRCSCGGQFGDQLRQVSAPFSAPGPRQNPSGPRGCWAKWCQLPERGPGVCGKVIGV